MTALRILGRILAQTVWWQIWPILPRNYPPMPDLHRRRYESIKQLADGRLRSRKVWTVEDVRFLIAIIEGDVTW